MALYIKITQKYSCISYFKNLLYNIKYVIAMFKRLFTNTDFHLPIFFLLQILLSANSHFEQYEKICSHNY